jgi:riboflavin kinase/FMN adenylyltransferase
METIQSVSSLGGRISASVVAIGNFDGVHRGHAHIFAEVKRIAAEKRAAAVVLTFEPHPVRILAPSFAPPLITPLSRKLELIAAHGMDWAIIEPFDLDFAALSPEEFSKRILETGLSARHVCVGYDFTFGAGRTGTTETLTALGKGHHFTTSIVSPVAVDGLVCSSTKVREFVLEGNIEGATLILGRPPEIEGEVVRGDGRGRTLGIPTANLRTETELLPKNGVYAGWAELLDDRRRFRAAINIGTNPTFTGDRPVTVEAHLLDVELDLYGRRLRVEIQRRLRSEERFPSREALLKQIKYDIAETRRLAVFASIERDEGNKGH